MVEPMSIYKSCPPRIVVTGSVLRTERICMFVTASHTVVNKNKNEIEEKEKRKKKKQRKTRTKQNRESSRIREWTICFSGKEVWTVRKRHKRNERKKKSHAEWKKTHLTRTTGKQHILSSFYNENKAFTLLFFRQRSYFFLSTFSAALLSEMCFFCVCLLAIVSQKRLFFPTSHLNTHAKKKKNKVSKSLIKSQFYYAENFCFKLSCFLSTALSRLFKNRLWVQTEFFNNFEGGRLKSMPKAWEHFLFLFSINSRKRNNSTKWNWNSNWNWNWNGKTMEEKSTLAQSTRR